MITDDRVNFKIANLTREGTLIKQIDGCTAWLVRLDTGCTVVAWPDELTVIPRKVIKPTVVPVEASVKPRRKKKKK